MASWRLLADPISESAQVQFRHVLHQIRQLARTLMIIVRAGIQHYGRVAYVDPFDTTLVISLSLPSFSVIRLARRVHGLLDFHLSSAVLRLSTVPLPRGPGGLHQSCNRSREAHELRPGWQTTVMRHEKSTRKA